MDNIENVVAAPLSFIDIDEKLQTGVFTVDNKRGRSAVWECLRTVLDNHLNPIEDIVACRFCHVVLKHHKKSTTNLLHHSCVKNITLERNRKIEVSTEDKKKVLLACGPLQILNLLIQ